MKNISSKFSITTPFGNFTAAYTENGLAGLNFPNAKTNSSGPGSVEQKISPKVRDWHRTTEAALKTFFAGREPKELPPLDLMGTEFQKNVWRAMLKIPYGRTKSYGEIAQAVGKPKAVRAVGGACGANSIPVLVPCHRVLAANKKIGGFSSGLGWKCKLLELEGINL
ncbi:MAG TPA: methylated-DNA--[protein]-cysteine S-methyltransferase [Candidatus Acidoferrum sp.]|nr:methylated-DNA--[protein]-cysteine S-methyltransferase [Candidatus Acidoferrum sp.]